VSEPRLLGVLLCYNDGDLLDDSISYLLNQNHDLVVWDHGSTDETAGVISRFKSHLRETRRIPREFDFYDLYGEMSRHLIAEYVRTYDWISWPDQDEFLEGPTRGRSYREYLREALESPFDWIQFNNYNYWFTVADDAAVPSAVARVRHYCLFPDCAPRIRSWRASSTNIRCFNHNPPDGQAAPAGFNLRHYPMRSARQMQRRLQRDRAGLRRGGANFHYENMTRREELLQLLPSQLHYDDGVGELNPAPVFNWRTLYGHGPEES